MVATWADGVTAAGVKLAEAAYGASVLANLRSAIDLFRDDGYKKQCLTELEVRNTRTLETGLRKLSELLQ